MQICSASGGSATRQVLNQCERRWKSTLMVYVERAVEEVVIRPYAAGDRAHVVALWREVFPGAPAHNVPAEDIERKLAIQSELFLVAIMDDRLVGTAMAGYDGHRGWVYYVAVSPAWQRCGIGTALMRRVETALAALGCPKLNLQVRAENEGIVAFYRQLGYEIEPRVSMGKRLSL